MVETSLDDPLGEEEAAGGEGKEPGIDGRVGVRGAGALEDTSTGVLEAFSQYAANLPRVLCHALHSTSPTNKLYLMLLKNSTSIT